MIHRSLEPFWGVSPHDLRRMQLEHESHKDSYTIGKNADIYAYEDDVRLLGVSFGDDVPNERAHSQVGQAREIMDTLKDVSQWIPPFRAVFSPHDNPNLFTDWEIKDKMLQAVATGTCMYFSSSSFCELYQC